MNFRSLFLILCFISCGSQSASSKTNVQFEDIYHHYFNLTSEKFLILDSQVKLNEVYTAIAQHYGGKRRPPIPQVNVEEQYVIVKPTLNSTNDVEITKVELQNQTLYIDAKPFYNGDQAKNSRVVPNILLKIYTKQDLKRIIVNNQN